MVVFALLQADITFHVVAKTLRVKLCFASRQVEQCQHRFDRSSNGDSTCQEF